MAPACGDRGGEENGTAGDPDIFRFQADQLRTDHGIADHLGDSDAPHVRVPAEILCGRNCLHRDQRVTVVSRSL